MLINLFHCNFYENRDFYYVNDYFGDVQAPSVKDSDLNMAHELVSRAYGSRISTSWKV